MMIDGVYNFCFCFCPRIVLLQYFCLGIFICLNRVNILSLFILIYLNSNYCCWMISKKMVYIYFIWMTNGTKWKQKRIKKKLVMFVVNQKAVMRLIAMWNKNTISKHKRKEGSIFFWMEIKRKPWIVGDNASGCIEFGDVFSTISGFFLFAFKCTGAFKCTICTLYIAKVCVCVSCLVRMMA